jgi:UDP-glucose 4-epimerase
MGSNVLVTGGAGFIGSHLVPALLAEGHAVRVVDNLSTGFPENLAACQSKIEFVRGDLADDGVALTVTRDIEFVLHQAALPSVARSVRDPLNTQRSGEVVTLRVLQSCAENKVKRMIFASSSSVYGDSPVLPRVETMPVMPRSPYAASKAAGELYARAYAASLGVDTASLRYFNIFGPRQNPHSPYSAVIALFLDRMRQGQAPQVQGNGEQSRDFTYVDNAVHANLLALRVAQPLNGAVFNVGCGGRISVLTLISTLNEILGTSLQPVFGPARVGDVPHSQADISRAREVLGYAPRVAFAEGLRRLAAAK